MNKTRQDAYERVVQARTGCLAGAPTYEYLIALECYVHEWANEIDRAIAQMEVPDATV